MFTIEIETWSDDINDALRNMQWTQNEPFPIQLNLKYYDPDNAENKNKLDLTGVKVAICDTNET